MCMCIREIFKPDKTDTQIQFKGNQVCDRHFLSHLPVCSLQFLLPTLQDGKHFPVIANRNMKQRLVHPAIHHLGLITGLRSLLGRLLKEADGLIIDPDEIEN